ncbi:flavanone 3-dioxygenase 3 [Cynara cardunculus var. scolymus]|uniref:flavanone 3-dioxygenase 3 n=1 Tax=Cynara cardunculus var. scolymus TaxID=59895 RepID=UPI000D62909D|nr:flavanone 3-dioxygenase 3 [Cynara cardunculus var. scolymus]
MDSGDHDEKTFSIGETPQETRFSHVPKCYDISPSDRPTLDPEMADVVVIDLAGLNDPDQRPTIVKNIGNACRESGFFQIINHGITQKVLDEALGTAFGFFNLPTTEKVRYMSNDIHKPVRYGTSIKDGMDKIQFWRVFLKLYAHPLNQWIHQWPDNPPDYREKMGEYAMKARHLAIELMGVITESLGIGPKYLGTKMEDGLQVLAVNCYPECPEPHMALGLPPHSDYSCITIVLHSSCGLEIMDTSDATWRLVPELHGALQVHIGDHVEVLSNGLYKSMVHRVTLNNKKTRVSIASLHSLEMDEKMATAKELTDDEHPKKYKESSFSDFLDFLSNNDITEGKSFIESLKIN